MKRIKQIILFLILSFIMLSITGCAKPPDIPPRATQGTLDLQQWDFSRYGVIRLDGEWEFYWKKYLTNEQEFAQLSPDGYFSLPGVWNKKPINEKRYPAEGYATLRLKILLPDNSSRWSLITPTLASCYRLYTGQELIAQAGIPSTNRKLTVPGDKLYVIPLTPTNHQITLVLHLANYHFKDGGALNSFFFGDKFAIQKRKEKNVGWDMVAIGVLLIMSIYHFSFYILRRKDRYTLYFGILCLAMALRSGFLGSFFYLNLFPNFNWYLQLKIVFFCSYILLPAFAAFYYEIFPTYLNKTVIRFVYIISALFSLFIIVTPPYIFSPSIGPYSVFTSLAIVYFVYTIIKALLHREKDAWILLAGVTVFFITAIHDNLIINNTFWGVHLMSFGFLVFVFAQSFIISSRFSRSFALSERLTAELENKVRERTAELETERNKLKVRNDIIETELSLARKIQMQYIPASSPSLNISFYYKPMEQIGGDFFDFIRFVNGNIGIFLSDVSGHGVPAAFVTSMIKSFTLQFAELIDNPAEFLTHLNGTLMNQTGGNFVTAFYGIYNPSNREFIYANAGHNCPYLLKNEKVEQLENRGRGIPLGVLTNPEMEQLELKYENNHIILPSLSKLFLYTDGLVETVNFKEQQKHPDLYLVDFESDSLRGALKEFQSLPCTKFINQMVAKLTKFRGAPTFDDDVCMICLDVK